MNQLAYAKHLRTLQNHWEKVLSSNGFDAAVVSAGTNSYYFADDQQPPFHAEAHFLRWVPIPECEHAALLVVPGEKPTLFWHAPEDYWYLPTQAPTFAENHFHVKSFSDLDKQATELENCTTAYKNILRVGPQDTSKTDHVFSGVATKSLRQLDYNRAFKTQFERECIAHASTRAVYGHRAAALAFRETLSEFEIHQRFLSASRQSEATLPYPNIVGLNEHAATLHYQHYDVARPEVHRSLLIDAGGKSDCYQADITRTYTHDSSTPFEELVSTLDEAQQALIETLAPGKSYLDLHIDMSRRISQILCDFGLISCSPESAFDQRLTDAFFPHGLGHLLGLQTHDVGGHIVNENGDSTDSHTRFTSLRLLRTIETDMVFTIEPGIYFIPMLLEQIRHERDVNWSQVDRLLPYGGLRIEDNVMVEREGVHNFTRAAFAAVDDSVG